MVRGITPLTLENVYLQSCLYLADMLAGEYRKPAMVLYYINLI